MNVTTLVSYCVVLDKSGTFIILQRMLYLE